MAVTVLAGALEGIQAIPIEVEVELLRRLPAVTVVGLAASAVRESAERVRSAIATSGLEFPRKRVVVNLAPADVRKDGTSFDLPVALGILAADGQIPPGCLDRWLIAGELSLGGALRPVRGALAMALLAREIGRDLLVPRSCAAAAAVVPGLRVACADDLIEVVRCLQAGDDLPSSPHSAPTPLEDHADLREVRGQGLARRALEISAAGGHHLRMVGPPGCGKTMLARRLPTLLPPLTFEEALEVTQIHEAAGLHPPGAGVVARRPFRAPHHSVTIAGLIGDRTLRPGEVSLAHHGVLFLDEAAEFSRSTLEVLREPLEEGVVRLTRAAGSVVHPASLTLVLASNPCPCGRWTTRTGCSCSEASIFRYHQRLSGPLLDRVDLHLTMEPVASLDLLDRPPGESSAVVRSRVLAARLHQHERGQPATNARLEPEMLDRVATCTPAGRSLMARAIQHFDLSARAATRVRKVARTIADLANADIVDEDHVAEALLFRAPAAAHLA